MGDYYRFRLFSRNLGLVIDKVENAMSIKSIFSADEQKLMIHTDSHFDFSEWVNFRNSYEEAPKMTHKFVVNMARTRTIDSSALSMLIVLKDYAQSRDSTFRIVDCWGVVRETFSLTNLDCFLI